MEILIYVSFGIFIMGLIIAQLRYGWTRSISALWDELEDDPNARGIWFMWWQFAFCLPFAIIAVIANANGTMGFESHFLFLAALLIMFSAYLGDTEEHKIIMTGHTSGAVGGIFFAAVFIVFTANWWLVIIGLLATWYMKTKPVTNHTYWIETVWMILITIDVWLELNQISLFNPANLSIF